jgi:MFS family permease
MAPLSTIHVINFGRKLAVTAVFFLVPLHFLKLGFSGLEIGIVTSLYAFSPLLFSFPTGWANDRFAIKQIIHAALGLFALLCWLLARIHAFLPTAAVFLLLGMTNNALDVSINSLYFKDEAPVDQNKKYSRLVFWQSLGAAAGPVLGGLIISRASFPAFFAATAVFVLAFQIFVHRLNNLRFAVVPLRIYRSDLLRKKTILFAAMIFVLALHWGVEGTVYSPFLKTHFNLTTFSLSVYISLSLLALALSSLLVGFIRFDVRINKRVFLTAMLLSGLGLMGMINHNLRISFAFRLVHEFGDGIVGALVVLWISRLFEKPRIGGNYSVLLTVMTCGHMMGAIIFASLGFRLGLIYPFLAAGLLLALNSGYGFWLFRKVEY